MFPSILLAGVNLSRWGAKLRQLLIRALTWLEAHHGNSCDRENSTRFSESQAGHAQGKALGLFKVASEIVQVLIHI